MVTTNGRPDTEGSYVDIAIHLFDTAELELDDYNLDGQGIRQFIAGKGEWLLAVAGVADKLINDGWTLLLVRDSIEARHSEVRTCEEAARRLRRLQIEEEMVIDIAMWSANRERLSPA